MNDDTRELVRQWKVKAQNDWYPITSSEMNEVIEISKKFSNILLPKLEQ